MPSEDEEWAEGKVSQECKERESGLERGRQVVCPEGQWFSNTVLTADPVPYLISCANVRGIK